MDLSQFSVRNQIRTLLTGAIVLSMLAIAGCGTTPPSAPRSVDSPSDPRYLVGAGDTLNIIVWNNPELSTSVPVRPDGLVTTPLVEDIEASNKTPTALARDIEEDLRTYLRDPVVTVIVTGFAGPYDQQVRVLGQAAQPQALQYREDMTVMDVMIAVGGLTEFAAGNRAVIVRKDDEREEQYNVRLDDLVNGGDISANVDMLPGDILVIPESFF